MARGTVTVLLFGPARETAGTGRLVVDVPDPGLAARALVDELARRYPKLARTLAVSRLVRNGRYLSRLTERVRPGDEVAVHPPYGGG
ncbi:MAG TPA: MoaD/ThiS family protein [Thermoplasmata archaeon]|jgi:molybdopterin converting factor small subunit|nr:MoaD/ThiS family protein [Thermoplasmata archaeon]